MKTTVKSNFLLLLVMVAFFASCRKDYNFTPTPTPPPPPPPPGTTISFATDVWPRLSASSAMCGNGGCHDGGTAPNLSSQSAAYTELTTTSSSTSSPGGPFVTANNSASSIFYLRIAGSTHGPNMADGSGYGTLSAADIAKVKEWIDNGAKP